MADHPAPVGASITRRAREGYDTGQIELLRATVAKPLSLEEFGMFLEVAARYDLDPFSRQIYPVKINGVVQPVVAKDGFLALANREPDFRGVQSDVVHEHDHFEKYEEPREDGTMRVRIDHRYRDADGKPTHGGTAGELRGPIVGAYARCRREGHDDTYFFAYWAEYDKRQNTWKTHPHAMMQKVPESMALRKAYSLAGLIHEAEVPRTVLSEEGANPGEDLAWPEDPELAERLKQGVEIVGWRQAKVRLKLAAADTTEKQEALLKEISREIDQGEDVTDAEVVA